MGGGISGSGNVLAQVTVDRSTSIDDVKQGPRKTKRVRVQLDERTELTDEELKIARAQYVEGQEALRREIEEKRLEKEGARLISQMLYGVPPILKAPTLVDFWTDNFKVLVETRSGALHIKTTGVPPAKRRRLSESPGRVEAFWGERKFTRPMSQTAIRNLGIDAVPKDRQKNLAKLVTLRSDLSPRGAPSIWAGTLILGRVLRRVPYSHGIMLGEAHLRLTYRSISAATELPLSTTIFA
ncbi:hypothetical protein B0F90DRAFT_142700 [Multifurca ochricompacta]|uniref:Uncharacterized protein n=1 Tax=Multifurca ochricompacta TaxID=376703 RepID=A0AAD4QU63_9AGAM|nr:hypothetical protein B0F90DRAFT_142700 [Multifurca ochricompacta]